MKEQYTSLLKEIQQTILSFSNGTIHYTEALQKYTNLKERFSAIKSKPIYTNYILNCLATHNAMNFSIFSAIVAYTTEHKVKNVLVYHGHDTFLQSLDAHCNISFFASPPRFVLDHVFDKAAIQNFSCHSSLLFNSEELSIVFVALTSSSFFSKETFLHYAALLKHFFSPFEIAEIITLDVPNKTLKFIHQVCTKLLTKEPCSIFGIYLIAPFSTLSHFGLYALNEVSESIKTTLTNTFGIHCFALSMNLYLCITTNTEIHPKTLTITYNDVVIPSKIYHKIIHSEEEIIPAITEILHFHNFI